MVCARDAHQDQVFPAGHAASCAVVGFSADVVVWRSRALIATGAHWAHPIARAARSLDTSTRSGSRTRRVRSCSAETAQAAPRNTAAAMNATWKPDTRAARAEPGVTGPCR